MFQNAHGDGGVWIVEAGTEHVVALIDDDTRAAHLADRAVDAMNRPSQAVPL